MEQYLIKYKDKVFEASPYQCEIFDNVKYGVGNMVINAAAGASKTTTIVSCIELIPEKEKILFIAFNTDIVNTIIDRIGKRNNVSVMTFHSLGYSILKESCHVDQINEYKYKNYIRNNIKILSSIDTDSLGKRYATYIRNIVSLVEYCRYYMAMSEREIATIAMKYDITPIADELKICKQVLVWGKDNISEIDFTDMIWLPNILNLQTKNNLYDRIFIDEGQDTSVVEQMLIEKTFKRGARLTVVADTFQQINIWCGASDEAIEHFKEMPNTKEFSLPISYRCPKKIVEIAKNYSDNIVATDDAIDGEINHDVSKYAPNSGDMVLCRTTAPLIKLHLEYNKINKKSYIRGFENVKETYFNLIDDTKSVTIDRNCVTEDGLFPQLYKKLIKTIENVQNKLNIDYEEALEHPSVFTMYDAIEGISTFSEGLNTVEELREKINIVFNGTEEDAVQLSTVHKAKGLEADNVFILKPSLMPLSYAKRDWEKKTERNLIYVAITRAKKSLNYIKEDYTFKGKDKTMKESIEQFRIKYGDKTERIKEARNIVKNIKVAEIGVNTAVTYNVVLPKRKKGGMKLLSLKK